MQIQNGATLQYQGLWFGDNRSSGDFLVSSVTSDLAKRGMSVTASSNNGGFKTVGGSTFGVSMTIKVNNGTGFADEKDVISIIGDAITKENALGNGDQDSVILTINNPNPSVDNNGVTQPGGTDIPTGARPLTGAPGTPGSSSPSGILPQWLKNLFKFPSLHLNLGPLLIILLGIGIITAIIFIVMPPKVTAQL